MNTSWSDTSNLVPYFGVRSLTRSDRGEAVDGLTDVNGAPTAWRCPRATSGVTLGRHRGVRNVATAEHALFGSTGHHAEG